ncbi:MAG: hypothetical protein AB8B55_05650 [Mariniblastus sp.]
MNQVVGRRAFLWEKISTGAGDAEQSGLFDSQPVENLVTQISVEAKKSAKPGDLKSTTNRNINVESQQQANTKPGG